MMNKIFVPEQFVDTKWHTAKDKADFANHLIRFINSGYKRTLFYKPFYNRLNRVFCHIAHYDIYGFYEYWFESREENFINHIKNAYICGDPTWTWSDVERAIQTYVKEHY